MSQRVLQERIDEYKCDGCGAIATHKMPDTWSYAYVEMNGIPGSLTIQQQAAEEITRPWHWCSEECMTSSFRGTIARHFALARRMRLRIRMFFHPPTNIDSTAERTT